MIRKIFREIKLGIDRYILNSLGGCYLCPRLFRVWIYRLFGNHIESRNFYPHCYIGGSGLTVKSGTFISTECFFDLSDLIYIGKNVHIAMRCTFVTSTHFIDKCERRAGKVLHSPINIGDGCWIGANVSILPGVSIGKGTIIAAGAVVINDCEANSMYAGVPAVKIKTLN